jgi:hypothetical protein
LLHPHYLKIDAVAQEAASQQNEVLQKAVEQLHVRAFAASHSVRAPTSPALHSRTCTLLDVKVHSH